MTLSEDLFSNQKVLAIADIKSIQAQLIKPAPDKNLMNRLKEGLGWLANIAGIADFFSNVHR